MKKIMMTLTLLFGVCLWTMAETVDEFVNAMKDDPTVEYVELTPEELLSILNLQGMSTNPNAQAFKELKKVSYLQVLSGTLPNHSTSLKTRLASLTVDNLDEMINTNEDGELTRVWMQTDGHRCNMILVVNADESDHDWQVVKLHCDIDLNSNFNLNKLIQMN